MKQTIFEHPLIQRDITQLRNKNTNSETYLELYMNTDKDDDVYLVDYNTTKSHSYTSVYYNTNDLNRVFWTSVDTFCVY